MIDLDAKKKVEDEVQRTVDSWPDHVKRIAYKYLHNGYGVTLSNIDQEIDKGFRVNGDRPKNPWLP